MVSKGTSMKHYGRELFDAVAITPWFSYRVPWPEDPIPALADRPVVRVTEKDGQGLVIRPLVLSDLPAFHALRSSSEAQSESWARGHPSKSLDESRAHLEQLVAEPDSHWYFGAFLDGDDSDNALVGEGGLVRLGGDTVSGWPEVDLVVHPCHRRRGVGAALFTATVTTWWALPRVRRRFQLHPYTALGLGQLEAGDNVVADCLGLCWEQKNGAAEAFFASVLSDGGKKEENGVGYVTETVTFEEFDKREGSATQGELLEWRGTSLANPVPFVDPLEEEEEAEEE